MTFTISSAHKLSKYNKKYNKVRYKEILSTFFYELSKSIIYDKLEYKFPYGGGSLRVSKNPSSNKIKKLDYAHFNKTGEKRYHINRHTNGYYFFFLWGKGKSYWPNCKVYKFEVTRGNDKIIGARGLAKHIKECAENPLVKDYDVMQTY
jgi:hypothetical protein